MRRILKCTCIDISSFSKPIASVFGPPPMTIFSYGTEICPPLVQLIGHVSALTGYIEM